VKKFMAAAAVGMAALALHSAPTSAETLTSQAVVHPVDGPTHRDAGEVGATETLVTPPLPSAAVVLARGAHRASRGGPETPRVHLAGYATDGPVTAAAHVAASGVAILMWAAVTAGLFTMRIGNGRLRRARRHTMSDEELRELVGIRPGARPAT
jgi:hypothetical protein